MSDALDIKLQQIRLRNEEIFESSMRYLRQAEELGSMQDWGTAIREARSSSDKALRDEVRYRQAKAHAEAANVLSDAYEGKESIELSGWAAGAQSVEEVQERAAELLKAYKSNYS